MARMKIGRSIVTVAVGMLLAMGGIMENIINDSPGALMFVVGGIIIIYFGAWDLEKQIAKK